MTSLTRKSIQGKKPDGSYTDLKCDSGGILKTVGGASANTAFGESLVGQLCPRIQESFIYNINSRVWNTTVANNGTATVVAGMATLQSSTTVDGSAIIETVKRVKYRPGLGVRVRFTALFTTTALTDYDQLIGIGDVGESIGFFFGHDEDSALILHNTTEYRQALWNVDPCDGTGDMPVIDFSKGNVYQITYQFLGFGMIKFHIENPDTGEFQLVHQIAYANANTVPSLTRITLPLTAYVDNAGTTDNITLQTASMAGFVEGIAMVPGITNAKSNSKTLTGTENSLLTIRNKALYQLIDNYNEVKGISVSLSNDDTKSATFRIVKNVTTLGGTPAYNDYDTKTSVIDFDIAGTTLTGGTELASFIVGPASSIQVNLQDLDVVLEPSDTLTISSDANGDAFCALIWREEL